jgi:hypothetical protein
LRGTGSPRGADACLPGGAGPAAAIRRHRPASSAPPDHSVGLRCGHSGTPRPQWASAGDQPWTATVQCRARVSPCALQSTAPRGAGCKARSVVVKIARRARADAVAVYVETLSLRPQQLHLEAAARALQALGTVAVPCHPYPKPHDIRGRPPSSGPDCSPRAVPPSCPAATRSAPPARAGLPPAAGRAPGQELARDDRR